MAKSLREGTQESFFEPFFTPRRFSAHRTMYGSTAVQHSPTAAEPGFAKASAPYICEFVGTCLLVFGIGVCGAHPNVSSLVLGALLAALVYICGPISGAHLNPAVSVACGFMGYTPWRQAGFSCRGDRSDEV